MVKSYPLSGDESRALEIAVAAMDGELDALKLMNALCKWPDPPAMDERWEKKLATACVMALAFCKQAKNYKACLDSERAKRHALRNDVAAFFNGTIGEDELALKAKLFNNRGRDSTYQKSESDTEPLM